VPWRCPACHTSIQHADAEDHPRPGMFYRCHICRLELALDPETDKLAVAPMRQDEPDQKIRRTV